MKDRLRLIGLTAILAGCGSGAIAPSPTPDVEYRNDQHILQNRIPDLLFGDQGFTCYTNTPPDLTSLGNNKTQVHLTDATCDNNDTRDINDRALQHIRVTPGAPTETIIFVGNSDQITLVSR